MFTQILPPKTLALYTSRRFMLYEFISIAIFTFVTDIFDFSDMLRKWGHQPFYALRETLSHTPNYVMLLLPFSLFIATMAYFYSLNRNKELAIIFMKGISPFSLAFCPLAISILLGLASAISTPSMISEGRSLFSIKGSTSQGWNNLWTIEKNDQSQIFIHLQDAKFQKHQNCQNQTIKALTAQSATIYQVDANGSFQERISSQEPLLCGNHWELSSVTQFDKLGHGIPSNNLSFPASLTSEEIAATTSAFNAFPVWKLPTFIAKLHAAGFDVLKYKIYLQTLLALPFFCAIMTLAGCTASSSFNPLTHLLSPLFIIELGIGFGLFAFIHVAEQFGKMGIISPFMSIWVPLIMTFGVLVHFFLNHGLRR